MTQLVEGTNDSSCLSKCSAAKTGYFNDDFLSYFVTKCPRRAPLIHMGYTVRVAIINNLVETFLTLNIKQPSVQIVSIGAGFDTLFFKLKKDKPHTNLIYFELDLPRVVKRKIKSIQTFAALNHIIGEFSESDSGLNSKHYKLLSVDLRNINDVRDLFNKYGVNVTVPTLFLSECVITYLDVDKSSQLIKVTSEFENASFITYEQIHPDDRFGQVMLEHFSTLQSPLKSVEKYPTMFDQMLRYIDCDWDQCTSLSALDAYFQLVSEEERNRVLRLEPFDEWEEFYLKCVHYAVVIASKGSLHDWTRLTQKLSLPRDITVCRHLRCDLVESGNVARYGHSAVLCGDDLLLIGGFGKKQNGKHGRLKDISWLKLNREEFSLKTFRETEDVACASMYSTWTPVTDSSYIVYGGRSAPTECTNTSPILVSVNTVDGSVVCKSLVNKCDRPPRWRHSAVIAQWNGDPALVVFGGRTSDLKILNDTWLVSLGAEDSKIITLPHLSDHPCARFSHSASVRRNSNRSDEMWVAGGMGESGLLGDLWCLDLTTLCWRRDSRLSLLARAGHSSSVHDDQLILVGGFGSLGHFQPGVAVVHLLSGLYMEYQLPSHSPRNSLMSVNHSHVVLQDQETLLIVGGGGNCFSFGTFFNSHICVIELKDLLCK